MNTIPGSFEMSLIMPRKCPIGGCRYNKHAVHADRTQTIKHIFNDHDYQQKLEAAVSKGLIHDISEHRSPLWLAQKLADFSLAESDG
jgi:hypothetical protein